MKLNVSTEEVMGLFSWFFGERQPRFDPQRQSDLPFMKWTQSVFQEVMRDIASHAPERGGILLGPVGEQLVSHFAFDETGIGTSASWTFGHNRINDLLRKYAPLRVDMKGFVHSHPSGISSLSGQDLKDFRKPFDNARNGELTEILAPLVVDGRIYPYILYRDTPKPVLAQLVLC